MSKVSYQQGDVILRPISKLPEGYELTEDKVLQEGETTGHKHQFLDTKAVSVYALTGGQPLNQGDTIHLGIGKVVIVRKQTELTHEEHKPISLPPGVYEMDLVREYDYDKEETARVLD